MNNCQLKNDHSNRFLDILEITLLVVRDTSLNNKNAALLSRLTSTKNLSPFSGDPLEWIRFKEDSEHSTKLGKYTDR